MRYQEYKNKMLKIRKVLDIVYRLRFVILGVTVASIAAGVTLDLTKGSITETSKFAISYKYGEQISVSGSAFMGEVTFEYREVGQTEWTTTIPTKVGEYEARARSLGNHGYKYSDVSKFEITPTPVEFNIRNDKIDYGDDSPSLSYVLLNGDKMQAGYVVNYEDLSKNTTTAKLDLNTVKILNNSGEDVTNCYEMTAVEKEITFIKQRLDFSFANATYYYDGNAEKTADEYTYTGELHYGHQIVISGGVNEKTIGRYENAHAIKIMKDDVDYSANYDIKITDSVLTIAKAKPLTVTSNDLSKEQYDGKTFKETDFEYTVEGLLPIHHVEVEFLNLDQVSYCENKDNDFNLRVLDKDDNDVSDLYEKVNKVCGKINIPKRKITIASNSDEVTFDNKPHYKETFTVTSGSLADDEAIEVTNYNEFTHTGTHENVQEYVIKHGGNIVTDNYIISTTKGNIKINSFPLKFNFIARNFDYDSEWHDVYNYAELDSSTPIPAGWTYQVSIPNFRMKDYKDAGYVGKSADVVYNIYDELGNNVTSDFTSSDLTSTFQTSSINKVNLTLTVKDKVKDFDNVTLSNYLSFDTSDPECVYEASGLRGSDVVKFNFKKNSDKSIKDYSSTPYNISYDYEVDDYQGNNVSGNYNISFTGDKKTSDVTINQRDINLTTLDVSKTYDGNNKFTPMLEITSGNIGEEVIKIDNTVQYTVTSSNADTYPYNLSVDNVKVYLNNVDVTDNYAIHIYNSGQLTIDKRNVRFEQTSDTSIIYYDANNHGVYYNSPEITIPHYTSDNTDGLVPGHTYNVTETSYADPGSYYIDIMTIGDIHIMDGSEDVSNNYNIFRFDFSFEIVQKTVHITSKSYEKYYDSEVLDPQPTLAFDTYYEISQQNMISYTVDYNGTKLALNSGHRLVVTKTRQTIVDNAIDASSYPNEYDYKVLDSNDNDVTSYYLFDIVYGNLNVYSATYNLTCSTIKKQYDGLEMEIHVDSEEFEVGTGTRDKGAYIKSRSVGPKFDQHYKVKMKFESSTVYENYYFAGNYEFDPVVTIYDSGNNDVTSELSMKSDVVINFVDVYKYTYSISQIDIRITQKVVKNNLDVIISDKRTVNRPLASGDILYFGTDVDHLEQQNNRAKSYSAEFVTANIWIMRGSVKVNSCYNISLYSNN